MADTVLKILRLPPGLSDERRNALFKKFGAMETKTVRKFDKYTITFAKFPSKEIATNVFIRLHQLEVNGKKLSIEFANQKIMDNASDKKDKKTESKDVKESEMHEKDNYKAFVNKLNSWTGGHTFLQPPHPNLCYKYPPPTKDTLVRIAIQLIKEPTFYTQVLHLMNRMNLPPPFIEMEREFPTLKQSYDMEQYRHIFETEISETKSANLNEKDDEEEESEIDSDDETENTTKFILPQKRKLSQPSKRMKIPKFVNPQKQNIPKTSQKTVKPEEVFESVPKETKNVTFKLKTVDKLPDETTKDTESSSKESSNIEDGGFGLIFPSDQVVEKTKVQDAEKKQEFISSEQLDENRISVNDQKILPVFKNYHPGIPTYRLYIKNLAKTVEESDLDYIYKRYITKTTAENDHEYNVRLMQEGRMKGQAFITLQNVAQAQLALNETNGYILKDKPMVVQFGKVPKS